MNERTKERFSTLVLVIALVMSSAIVGIAAAETEYDKDNQSHHTDWSGDDAEDWHYADTQANAYGDDQLYSYNEDDPVQAHQVSTYSFAYDDYRSSWGTTYTPSSRQHKITVDEFSSPSGSGGISVRDPFGYDNAKDEALDDDVERAITLLHNFADGATPFPIPDPFALAGLDPDQQDISIDRTTTSATFHYNFDPEYQGADWLVRTSTPVKAGWYRMDVTNEANMGLFYCNSYGCNFMDEDNSYHFHAADFEVYR